MNVNLARAYLRRFMAADVQRAGKLDFAAFSAFLAAAGVAQPSATAAAAAAAAAAATAASAAADDDSAAESSVLLPRADTPSSPSADDDGDGGALAGAGAQASSAGAPAGAASPRLPQKPAPGTEADRRALFAVLDRDGDGALDFRELLVGMLVLHGHVRARAARERECALSTPPLSPPLPAPPPPAPAFLSCRASTG